MLLTGSDPDNDGDLKMPDGDNDGDGTPRPDGDGDYDGDSFGSGDTDSDSGGGGGGGPQIIVSDASATVSTIDATRVSHRSQCPADCRRSPCHPTVTRPARRP